MPGQWTDRDAVAHRRSGQARERTAPAALLLTLIDGLAGGVVA